MLRLVLPVTAPAITLGMTRSNEPQPSIPFCLNEGCTALNGLVCDDDGAHKAAMGHAEVTGHHAAVHESALVVYVLTGPAPEPAGDPA